MVSYSKSKLKQILFESNVARDRHLDTHDWDKLPLYKDLGNRSPQLIFPQCHHDFAASRHPAD
jgi:hypothetical protein